jgi:hypothetical protein
MNRLLGTAVVAAALTVSAACDDSPTEPGDETIRFTAQLSPGSEVPPVTNTEASGSGTVTIDLGVDRNGSGAITDAAAEFQVTLTGFPAATPLTMAHIHSGASGANGNIVVDTGLAAGGVSLTGGTGGFTKTAVAVTPAVAQDIINNPGSFYFNVHSVMNPAGMVRGQLVRQ